MSMKSCNIGLSHLSNLPPKGSHVKHRVTSEHPVDFAVSDTASGKVQLISTREVDSRGEQNLCLRHVLKNCMFRDMFMSGRFLWYDDIMMMMMMMMKFDCALYCLLSTWSQATLEVISGSLQATQRFVGSFTQFQWTTMFISHQTCQDSLFTKKMVTMAPKLLFGGCFPIGPLEFWGHKKVMPR